MIPGLGRSPGEGKGYPLQYSGLENPMESHGVARSRTLLSDLHFTSVAKSCSALRLFEFPWTVACQAPLSMGFFRQEYWRGLPFPSPGHLPSPGVEPRLLRWLACCLLLSHHGSPPLFTDSQAHPAGSPSASHPGHSELLPLLTHGTC